MVKHTIKGSHTSYSITENGDTWIFTRSAAVISNNSDAVTATGAVNTRIVVEGLISTISGAYAGISTSGTNVDINVAKGGRVLSASYGIDADAVGSRITIAGRVEGGTAIYSQAANVEIDIARAGKVVGNTGYSVIASGDNLSIDNAGTTTGRLSLSGYGVDVRNSGTMKVDANQPTIVSHDDDMHFVNLKSGSIIGGFQIETAAVPTTYLVPRYALPTTYLLESQP